MSTTVLGSKDNTVKEFNLTIPNSTSHTKYSHDLFDQSSQIK